MDRAGCEQVRADEIAAGDGVAERNPLASFAGFADGAGLEGVAHVIEAVSGKGNGGIFGDGRLEQRGQSCGREVVAVEDVLVAAVAGGIGEERGADVVGSEGDLDSFSTRRDEGGDAVEVCDELGRIAFAGVGEHAEKMVRAKANHGAPDGTGGN